MNIRPVHKQKAPWNLCGARSPVARQIDRSVRGESRQPIAPQTPASHPSRYEEPPVWPRPPALRHARGWEARQASSVRAWPSTGGQRQCTAVLVMSGGRALQGGRADGCSLLRGAAAAGTCSAGSLVSMGLGKGRRGCWLAVDDAAAAATAGHRRTGAGPWVGGIDL
jgi:hypothetical protein